TSAITVPRSAAASEDSVAVLIRARLATPDAAGMGTPDLVRRFYDARGHAPAWSDAVGVNAEAEPLVGSIRQAGIEGLDPRLYRISALEEAVRRASGTSARMARPSPADRAELDLLLTDAFLT